MLKRLVAPVVFNSVSPEFWMVKLPKLLRLLTSKVEILLYNIKILSRLALLEKSRLVKLLCSAWKSFRLRSAERSIAESSLFPTSNSSRCILLDTSKLVNWLLLKSKEVIARKSSIPVRSEIFAESRCNSVTFSINAVGTCPSPELSS